MMGRWSMIWLATALMIAPLPAAAKDTHDSAAGLALPKGDPLYRDLGGRSGIAAIIDRAMQNFLADKRIKEKFEDENIHRLKGMLTDYFVMVSGGPDVYRGDRDLKVVHEGLHLQNKDFYALVEDLQKAMDAQGISFPTQNRLLSVLAPMHRDVVTK